MTTTTKKRTYRPTESKYKGGAHEMYVTYDLEQKTRGGSATYHKVKRVYIAGDVKNWSAGLVTKKSGRQVHGVRVEYKQSRTGYPRSGYTAERGGTAYEVAPATVGRASQRFVQVVEVPEEARNIHFYTESSKLPPESRSALQNVR